MENRYHRDSGFVMGALVKIYLSQDFFHPLGHPKWLQKELYNLTEKTCRWQRQVFVDSDKKASAWSTG